MFSSQKKYSFVEDREIAQEREKEPIGSKSFERNLKAKLMPKGFSSTETQRKSSSRNYYRHHRQLKVVCLSGSSSALTARLICFAGSSFSSSISFRLLQFEKFTCRLRHKFFHSLFRSIATTTLEN